MTKMTKAQIGAQNDTMFSTVDLRRINASEHNNFLWNVIDSMAQQDDMTNGDLAVQALIPTNTNQLTNGSNFITSSGAPVQSVNGQTGTVSLTIPSVARTTSTDTQSLAGTGATGAQIHATKDSTVRYNVSTSTTSTIGGPSTSIISLKICATNNATEGSWTTVATLENDQTITLAIALSSIQVMKGQLIADVPASWYVKLVNSGTGTHSESFISGQKTVYG